MDPLLHPDPVIREDLRKIGDAYRDGIISVEDYWQAISDALASISEG